VPTALDGQRAENDPAEPFASIGDAIAELRAGKMIVVCDDEDRENEGDLVMCADLVTPDAINFMVRRARGLVCLALTGERCDALEIELIPQKGRSALDTSFCVTVDAAEGLATGVSAHDRAHTIHVAVDARSRPGSLVRPGHISPLRARSGGVLERAGHTEASVDLARLAGLSPAGVICEIMNDDGSMARMPDLVRYARRHDLKLASIRDLIAVRRIAEPSIEMLGAGDVSTASGSFRAVRWRLRADGTEHVALIMGDVDARSGVPVHLHRGCFSGDVLQSTACDCGVQLQTAMAQIEAQGAGVLVYIDPRSVGGEHHARRSDRLGSGWSCQGVSGSVRRADLATGVRILMELGVASVQFLPHDMATARSIDRLGLKVTSGGQVQLQKRSGG
jgi:3,4-dihydroxy 2-butanone 4-phosphate synthase/GTP cyclohydrolase II